MCWRQVSKFQKSLLVLLFYLTLYLLVSYALAPDEGTVTFVNNELRIGDKYVVMFLMSPKMPVYTDAESAEVFTSRQCGRCVVTNNVGFLPMSEYDAVLVHGERSMLSQTLAFMNPGKWYLLEAHKRCLRNKLKGCVREPRVTSFTSRQSYDLCGLCAALHKTRHDNLM